ncbi:outer membrane beta-barrel protein [Mucilaginibacter phyllosphaerae]|uniref:Outer membrane protein beta-barrel domain-containing protein n=1 Tax=Mucilaginibacter phyllosphaerae TaxID=1812349 RepID=A0A4Y8AJD0_9SPHI|nr:outer membrane beta-barrel protein [Mucilaginibacter phyllosphaerae]MBB3967833.1 hypothetical protein [Mucilaginibacter phyllosphaerae]TEW69123.1 hypothetical protein E2R65_02855 [Mucilaginibacter phyllosphaerae]GGH03008.1 hypothetical protein GCM10007352_05500 [Mucilaginibacter phyllosphaerae]
MNEQFDKKLSNRIRQVFDHYEHPGADAGWAQLKKQLPAKERRNKVAWLWWSSAAAIAVVFLGLGIWYNNAGTAINNMAVKHAAKQKQQPLTDHAKTNTGSSIKGAPLHADSNQPVIAQNTTPAFNRTIVIPAYTKPTYMSSSAANGSNSKPYAQHANPIGHPQPVFNNTQQTVIAQTKPGITTIADSPKIAVNIAAQQQIAHNSQPDSIGVKSFSKNTATPNNIVKQKSVKNINDMLAENNLHLSKNTTTADKQAAKKVNFSIYAATYFNYAEGSSSQINAGAGITSDFRLSKNLKLSTGVALAQNSLSYTSNAPATSAAKNMVAAAPALKQEALFATSAVLPIFKNYNASLVGLDIPINIKYEFNPQKNDTYVSAGLSSGTFINENYTYNYTYGNGASPNSNGEDQQTTRNSFNSFYFGKTLNLSFGVGYPVGGNRLIVEPFVKYPLGGLGAQDIRFGAGGVNLKFSFKTQKK